MSNLEVTNCNSIGLLYLNEPSDLRAFRENYPYFDPAIVLGKAQKRYHFFELIKLKEDPDRFNERLNQYLNVKFNPVGSYQSLEQNRKKFSALASESSDILRNILDRAILPCRVKLFFQESDHVSQTNNITDLINLYGESKDLKIKYEISRKIGLTFLLARVKNSLAFQQAFEFLGQTNNIIRSQLGIAAEKNPTNSFNTYFWLGTSGKPVFYEDEKRANRHYQKDALELQGSGNPIYPMQVETFYRQTTRMNNTILKYISRIKNQCDDHEDYTSVVEKIIRKNILYPSDVTDIYGITLVVDDEKAIGNLIYEIENFLGGTNTRKDEKVIQKSVSSKLITLPKDKNFRIWKAVYDITLPDKRCMIIDREIKKNQEDIATLQKTFSLISKFRKTGADLYFLKDHMEKKRKEVEELKNIREKLENKPFDIYVEIQIQEFHSYLLSGCYGSPTEHKALKREQVLASTFYKLFPQEIYKQYLFQFKG